MSDLIKLYHRLPYPLKCLAATMHGWHLRRWRYGPETERLVEEALEREHWPPERWKAWQEERLAYILHRAATKVPYYREYWRKHAQTGTRPWEELANWPILTKEPLRANPRAFLAEDCDPRRMYEEHTSGTTGTPLTLWQSRETVRAWYALFEARWRRWYGVSMHDRWAILGGKLVTPVSQKRPPFWVWNSAMNQLYMSAYHLAPDLTPYYLDALVKYRIKYLWGYSSSLYVLAQDALRLGRRDIKMAVVITNAEPLYDYQRKTIAEAFQCPVRETYGMCELVAAASECEHGRMHLWPEAGVVEVLKDNADEPAEPGESGRLVCTGLVNADMPLVRYAVGDRGGLGPQSEACFCGRTLGLIESVDGRCDDILVGTDGKRVGRLGPVFKTAWPLREAQIIQERLDLVRVLCVPADGFTAQTAGEIAQRLQERLGDVQVVVEEVAEIPRGPNGKFRAVVSKVDQHSAVGKP
jgi:phenylacetate-CoA ligase